MDTPSNPGMIAGVIKSSSNRPEKGRGQGQGPSLPVAKDCFREPAPSASHCTLPIPTSPAHNNPGALANDLKTHSTMDRDGVVTAFGRRKRGCHAERP